MFANLGKLCGRSYEVARVQCSLSGDGYEGMSDDINRLLKEGAKASTDKKIVKVGRVVTCLFREERTDPTHVWLYAQLLIEWEHYQKK